VVEIREGKSWYIYIFFKSWKNKNHTNVLTSWPRFLYVFKVVELIFALFFLNLLSLHQGIDLSTPSGAHHPSM
jgi:hypothetical protein